MALAEQLKLSMPGSSMPGSKHAGVKHAGVRSCNLAFLDDLSFLVTIRQAGGGDESKGTWDRYGLNRRLPSAAFSLFTWQWMEFNQRVIHISEAEYEIIQAAFAPVSANSHLN